MPNSGECPIHQLDVILTSSVWVVLRLVFEFLNLRQLFIGELDPCRACVSPIPTKQLETEQHTLSDYLEYRPTHPSNESLLSAAVSENCVKKKAGNSLVWSIEEPQLGSLRQRRRMGANLDDNLNGVQ